MAQTAPQAVPQTACDLRLIADDLTGALDSAMAFVRPGRPLPVHLRAPAMAGGSLAIDSDTRETDLATARRTVASLAACLSEAPACGAPLFFCKLDSLLRGRGAAEIAGWHEAMAFERCIIAPAFPHHGRVTRGGIQMLKRTDGARPVGEDLAAGLAALGFPVQLCRPGEAVPLGLSLWDVETQADLATIARDGRSAGGRILWCGSGGLALALAGEVEPALVDPRALPRPLLGLFGTDHPVTRAQVEACGGAAFQISQGGGDEAVRVAARLQGEGVALLSLALPDGTPRPEAAQRIADEFARLLSALPAPGTLVVSGGETLRSLSLSLGAERLDLLGAFETGIPVSVLRGGRFDGVHVVSKSGAFGDSLLLRRLIFPMQGARA
ncbi:hypothetical protein J5J86_06795 [Aquabacter sp. L1I39]|uniref:four-carbon acid sugar kinase family protein n=1 Tax=Aquabacter sp. L1I39 TaxID=2820278 RepID=UPI001ADA9F92|nr:four-carbon acid sugar kinase family protein [Aquabacter sp. L1I39]QTL05009.1 hypothetical protein J5J86_06795 [Aquabacter sp. L1I39]